MMRTTTRGRSQDVSRQDDPREQHPTGPSSPLDGELLDALESLAFGLVAITSRAIEEATVRGELTFQQWRVLVVLGGAPDGLRVSELAGRIAASGPSTSRLARRLERRGLVRSAVDPLDRRAVRLGLSPAGAALRERISVRRRELIHATILGHRASGDLIREMAAVARAFERWL
jgi:DNA-binding MarR family transcriptional regulator